MEEVIVIEEKPTGIKEGRNKIKEEQNRIKEESIEGKTLVQKKQKKSNTITGFKKISYKRYEVGFFDINKKEKEKKKKSEEAKLNKIIERLEGEIEYHKSIIESKENLIKRIKYIKYNNKRRLPYIPIEFREVPSLNITSISGDSVKNTLTTLISGDSVKNILTFLNWNDLSKIITVCKSFNEALDRIFYESNNYEIYYDIKLKDAQRLLIFCNDKGIFNFNPKYLNKFTLNVSLCNDDFLKIDIHNILEALFLTKVNKIKIKVNEIKINTPEYKHLKGLNEVLKIKLADGSSIGDLLEEIDLSSMKSYPSNQLISEWPKMKKLKIIKLSKNTDSFEEDVLAFRSILEKAPNLEKFSFFMKEFNSKKEISDFKNNKENFVGHKASNKRFLKSRKVLSDYSFFN